MLKFNRTAFRWVLWISIVLFVLASGAIYLSRTADRMPGFVYTAGEFLYDHVVGAYVVILLGIILGGAFSYIYGAVEALERRAARARPQAVLIGGHATDSMQAFVVRSAGSQLKGFFASYPIALALTREGIEVWNTANRGGPVLSIPASSISPQIVAYRDTDTLNGRITQCLTLNDRENVYIQVAPTGLSSEVTAALERLRAFGIPIVDAGV